MVWNPKVEDKEELRSYSDANICKSVLVEKTSVCTKRKLEAGQTMERTMFPDHIDKLLSSD